MKRLQTSNWVQTLTLLALGLASGSSHAIYITYGGQTATDGSGLTSYLVPANNIVDPLTGVFIETFDYETRMIGQDNQLGLGTYLNSPQMVSPIAPDQNSGKVIIRPNVLNTNGTQTTVASGCAINTYNILDYSTTGGGFAVQKGGVSGVAANPANDNTCFGFGPRPGGGTPATIKVDFSNAFSPGEKIYYLGLYYGSIDDYNKIAFYDKNHVLIEGAGDLADGIISGAEIRMANGGPGNAGSWTEANSNVYINMFFQPGEEFASFEFQTSGVAFELDNIVTSTMPVPEPESLALFGVALAGLGLTRRKSKQA